MNDPASIRAATGGKSLAASSLAWIALLIVALVAAVSAYLALVPGYLVEPISPNLAASAVFFGTLAALALVYRWVTQLVAKGTAPNIGQVLTIVAAVGLVGYRSPMGLVSAGVQIASFEGVMPVEHLTPLTITGSHYDWWAKRGGFYMEVRLPDNGYVVSLPVSRAAYDSIRAGDRVMLPVETGRNGIRRLIVPHPLGVSDLRRGAAETS